jgi:hypothetical protein
MTVVEPLTPWSEAAEHDTELERNLSKLLRSMPEPEPLPELARRRVGIKLRGPSERSATFLLLRLIAAGAVIGVTGAAAAQWAAVRWLGANHSVATRYLRIRHDPPPLLPQPVLPRRPIKRQSPPPEAAPSPVPPSTGAFAPAPVQSSRLGMEAASLEAVLSALRGGGPERAQRALSAVDRHLSSFPGGALELEARVARIDALLMLGRKKEARRELATLPIENVGRKNELRLIRAELRADDDCRAALGDFDVLVELPLPSAWAERALFGRGACLLKVGQKAGADRDFARYLERFPHGRFAEQIRAQDRLPEQ